MTYTPADAAHARRDKSAFRPIAQSVRHIETETAQGECDHNYRGLQRSARGSKILADSIGKVEIPVLFALTLRAGPEPVKREKLHPQAEFWRVFDERIALAQGVS